MSLIISNLLNPQSIRYEGNNNSVSIINDEDLLHEINTERPITIWIDQNHELPKIITSEIKLEDFRQGNLDTSADTLRIKQSLLFTNPIHYERCPSNGLWKAIGIDDDRPTCPTSVYEWAQLVNQPGSLNLMLEPHPNDKNDLRVTIRFNFSLPPTCLYRTHAEILCSTHQFSCRCL